MWTGSLVVFVWLGSLGCASSAGGYRAAHTLPWYEFKTEHFTIYSSGTEAQGRELGQRMELFRSVAELMAGREIPPARIPVRIFLIRRGSTLQAFAHHSRNLAWYSQSIRTNTFLVAGHRSATHTPISLLQWAYAHFLLANHGGFAYPMWYREGFSEFLSGVEVLGDGRVEVGGIPGPLHDQRLPGSGGSWEPLRRVFTMTYGERISRYQVRAQSWALVHYLNFGRSGRGGTAELTAYFHAMEKGYSSPDAVRRAFGQSVEDLDRELRRYVALRRYKSIVVDRTTFPSNSSVEVQRIPTHRIAAELGELSLSHARRRERWKPGYGRHKYDQAQYYFEEGLAAGAPDSAPLQLGIARAHLGAGRSVEAASLAGVVLEQQPDSAEAHLAMGEVLHARARDTDDPKARADLAHQARRHYVKSWKLDDTVPETYAMYGATFLLDGQDPKKGLETVEHAKTLLPASEEIRLILAKLHLASGDKVNARREALAAMYTYTSEEIDDELDAILDATEGVELGSA